GSAVIRIEDLPRPEHVVDDEHAARAERLGDARKCSRVELLFDVVEAEIERTVGALEGFDGLTDGDLDEIGEAEFFEVTLGASRELLVPDDVVDCSSPVLAHDAREPGRRVSETGSQLEYLACAEDPRQDVAELAGRGADDREVADSRLALHCRE